MIELPKLREMRFWYLPNLAAFSQGVEIVELPQITILEVTDCPNLRIKFEKCNIKLQKLTIRINDAIEEILWGDEIRDEGERHIIYPELKGVESIKLPKLKEMKIRELARMNNLLPLDSEATRDQHCLHFFFNQKVEILGLEKLPLSDLVGNINKIWCRRVPVNFFHNLKDLSVYHLVGITNIMSSSIAKNLVNLHNLRIESYPDMVVVIEDEKEVFVTSLFPKLRELVIRGLPKLKSFCHWENAFELPSLQIVYISDCPEMETFTLGSVRAPNLSMFWINNEDVGRKDLNDGIHDHFMTKIQDVEDEMQSTLSQPSNDFVETTEGLENDGNSVSIADPNHGV